MHQSISIASAISLLTIAVACSDEGVDDDKGPQENEATRTLEELGGVWRQDGYARYLKIGKKSVTTYDVSEVSCVQSGESAFSEVEEEFERIEGDQDQFSWFERGAFTRYDFVRSEQLPESCGETSSDALSVFDALWYLYDENYAFFDERGIDWEQSRDDYRSLLDANSSDDELLAVFEQLLAPFNDGHVYVFDVNQGRGFLGGGLGELWELWAEQFDGEPVGDNPIDPRGEFVSSMQDHVLTGILKGEGKSSRYDLMHWGWLSGDIAYLDVHAMNSFEVELSIPDATSLIDEEMAEIMQEFSDAKGMVVDVRFNQGGYDTMGYAIAGWFTDRERLVSRKRAINNTGWTMRQEIRIQPREGAFLGPVTLLTSRNTISAGETFSLAMRSLPQVTTVGTRTYGSLSDALVRVLPNGWIVSQSNESYESPEGDSFEAVGIPPGILTEYDDSQGYYENLDFTLQRALDEFAE